MGQGPDLQMTAEDNLASAWKILENGFGSKRMRMTLEKIRRDGLGALRAKLGKAGMIRFLQQFETGDGDYSQERHEWVDSTSLDDIKSHKSKGLKRRSKAV